uniref:Centromere protein P n=1 Tax=Macaca fascicularis TaxID=9541 RepID=A0A7N9ICT3_MACFA
MDAELAEERVLQAEIAAVRRACENPPAPWEEKSRVQKSFQAIHQFTSEGWKSSKDLKNQLGHLESELSFLSTLTGINIRNYSRQTEDLTSTEMAEKSIRKVLQRHRLSGNCHMVTFQLEFQILEIQNKERLSSAVTDLNIIMEPTECSELSEFVSRNFGRARWLTPIIPAFWEADAGRSQEDRKDLFMFFRSLHFFVEWFEYRKRTFKHFKEKYPDAVYLSEGPSSCSMGIRSASRPGFELVIVWRIQIDEDGKVFPKLDLLTKVPQRALELDKNRAIEAAPLSFRTLLGVLGIEAALESLIKSLCAEENN